MITLHGRHGVSRHDRGDTDRCKPNASKLNTGLNYSSCITGSFTGATNDAAFLVRSCSSSSTGCAADGVTGGAATTPSTFRSSPKYQGCWVIYSSPSFITSASAKEIRAVGSGTRMRDSKSFSASENQLEFKSADGRYGGQT